MAGFIPKNYNDGEVDPWVHLPAAKATYKIGQGLYINSSNGQLTGANATNKPTHICMSNITTETAGDPIPAILVQRSTEFEVALSSSSTLIAGPLVDLSSDGMGIDAAATNSTGAARITSVYTVGNQKYATVQFI